MNPKTILVVDDDPNNIDLLVGILKDHFIVKAARNGQLALKICQLPNKPDLVILDILMPDADGYEICRQLKATPATAAIPVIFLSGETPTQGHKHDAACFLSKPLEPEILLASIASVLAA